ncbi:S8 family serine peptidase [Lysobacter sp. Root690]|uniref:S8 family serine peptidase n=1 Tax=Lysobacter sp. Root690 TaxID=1736588 RepID=UPI0009EB978A|nr:S8 family serine peptidase [Lysobacter sp. Root690]
MSSHRPNALRVHLLAAATVAVLSAASPAFAGTAHLAALKAGQNYDRFIVKYRNGNAVAASTATLTSSLNAAAGRALSVSRAGGKPLALKHLRRLALGANVVLSDRRLNRDESESLMRQIAADPSVEYVEPDLIMHSTMSPNDPRYADQWHYANSAAGANVAAAWDKASGEGVVVAVVDSGILAHTDLNANILPGYDTITSTTGFSAAECSPYPAGCGRSDDGNGRDNDPNDSSNVQHGTHVAGTIAAVTNNAVGVSGVAYRSKIVPVRALGKDGSGATSDIADAILWAAGVSVPGAPNNPSPAEVINLSIGGGANCAQTQTYQDAINAATARGVTVVVAAGNSNSDTVNFTPASCDNTITVAASDPGGNRAFYSNYGNTIDITAPGGETCTPANEFLPLGQVPKAGVCVRLHDEQGVLSTVAGNGYGYMQGTSMAAPHVAGIVALMQSVATTPKTSAEVLQILKATARQITPAKCPGGCGAGLVDASAAVVAAAGGGGTPSQPVANFTSSVNGLSVSLSDTSTDSDGSIVARSWNFGDGTTSTQANPTKTYTAAGTYTITLTVTDDDGATNTKTAQVIVGGTSGGVQTYSNNTDVTIPDNNLLGASSSVLVAGRVGKAPADASVAVNIVHPYKSDLKVDLIAPDGSIYVLHNRTGGDGDNVAGTFKLNLSSENLNGTWKLRAVDRGPLDVGKIDSWSITF